MRSWGDLKSLDNDIKILKIYYLFWASDRTKWEKIEASVRLDGIHPKQNANVLLVRLRSMGIKMKQIKIRWLPFVHATVWYV